MDDRAPTAGAAPGHALSLARLRVEGMHCDSCAALISEALAEEPGVAAVEVSRDPDVVRLSYDPEQVRVDDLAAVINALGYAAAPLD